MIWRICVKNFKIIFRNPSIALLLILAPMLLMITVGLTYSGDSYKGISIGIIGTQTDSFLGEIQGIDYIYYDTSQTSNAKINCIEDIKNSKILLCLEITPNFDQEGNLISTEVIYYVDNTRNKINSLLVNSFDRLLQSKGDTISKNTVTTILDQIDETTNFIETNVQVLDSIIEDLSEFKTTAKFIERDFNNQAPIIIESLDQLESITQSFEENLDNSQEGINIGLARLGEVRNGLELVSENTDILVEEFEGIYEDNYETLEEVGLLSEFEAVLGILNELNDDVLLTSLEEIEILESNLDNFNTLTQGVDIDDELFQELDEVKETITDIQEQLPAMIQEIERREEDLEKTSQTLNSKLDEFKEISKLDAEDISKPVKDRKEFLLQNFKFIHQMAPAIVSIVALFITLLLTNIVVFLEKDSKATFRNLILPTNYFKFMIGSYLTILIIVFIQVLFLLSVLYSFFSINIFENLALVLAALFFFITFFILLGMIISLFCDDVQTSIIISTFCLLFFFLLSNMIYPIQLMPEFMFNILQYNPLVIVEELLRGLFFLNKLFIQPSQIIFIFICEFLFLLTIYILTKTVLKKN